MDIEQISLIAQKISFAFEDSYSDENRRKLFVALFDRYLSPVDPAGIMEPYDAIILLGRKNHSEFKQLVKEMEDLGLVPSCLL